MLGFYPKRKLILKPLHGHIIKIPEQVCKLIKSVG